MQHVWYNIGTAAVQTAELEMAIRCFRVSLFLSQPDDENSKAAWMSLGQCYKLRMQFDESAACFQKSLTGYI
jgi:tetratricopeptide (TPR) repeat protein